MQGYNDSQPVLTDGERGAVVPPGLLPLQGRRRRRKRRRDRARVPPHHEQQHLGPRLQRRRAHLRLDRQRQPERVHADSEPLLRSGPRLVVARVLDGIADSNQFDPITEKVRQVDQHGGFTAGAGHALYTARNYPQEYWNRTAFVCEPTGHLVGDVRAAAATAPASRSKNSLEPRRQRRRVDRADHGRGRPRRQRLGHRLVQLHRPAQPDAAGFKTGKGARLRNRPARQEARPHLSAGPRRTGQPVRKTPLPGRVGRVLPTKPRPSNSSPRSRATTCSGGCTPSGCWSSGARRTSCRSWSSWRRTRRATRSA